MTDKILALTTCGSAPEAEALAKRVIEAGMAACVSVIPQIRSYYRWNGEQQSAEEWQLVIKTCRPRFDDLKTLLEASHSWSRQSETLSRPFLRSARNYRAGQRRRFHELPWLDAEVGD